MTENVSWKSSCSTAALTLSSSHSLGWFRKTVSKLAVLSSCSLLVGAVITLCDVSCLLHALRLNCLLTGYFCTSSFATSFRIASVMFLSHDLQIWFSIEPWGIISAFGQVDGLYCISAKQTKVQLYHLTVEHLWFEKNSQNIPTFEKINAAHLIIKRQWTH